MLGDNIFLTVEVNPVVEIGYDGVGCGFVGAGIVIVPVAMSAVNVPPLISIAGCALNKKYLTVPVVNVGNCPFEYVRSN